MGRGRRLAYLGIGSIGTLAVLVYAYSISWFTADPMIIDSWRVFAILIAGVVVSAGYQPFQQLLMVGGFPGWHTLMVLSVLLVNVVANMILIEVFFDVGAALATAIAGLYSVVALKIFVRRVLRFPL